MILFSNTTQIILLVLMGICLVGYLLKRRARLRREE